MTVPLYNLTDSWTDGGTVYTAIKMDVTNTASATNSLLMNLLVGGTSRFKVDKNATTTITGTNNDGTTSPLTVLPSSGSSFTKIFDNGTMVIDSDVGTGTNPLTVKYNGGTRFLFSYQADLYVGDVAQTIGTVNIGQGRVIIDYIGTMRMLEISTPSGNANEARIFAKDNGAGKTQLMVIFGTGSAIQLAVEV